MNPEIVESEGKIVWEEGCLSVPDFTADVSAGQSRQVLKGTDLDGKEVVLEIRPRSSRPSAFQHEIDHLDGILFIDRISRLKRGMYVKRSARSSSPPIEQEERSRRER